MKNYPDCSVYILFYLKIGKMLDLVCVPPSRWPRTTDGPIENRCVILTSGRKSYQWALSIATD